jgi:predicted RNA-binding Zn-ribbon protein involved in translation (DUF1610 family)
MTLKQPESMDELIYFTRRTLEPKGRLNAWAFKKMCPKCKKALMGKPVEKGKVRIRALEYECPACKYVEEKLLHEDSLTVCVEYTCPSCSFVGEAEIPYKRKTWQGVKAFIFECGKCKTQIGVTKKMKAPKQKKGAKVAAVAEVLDDDDD